MNKHVKRKWVKALRSGEYAKGHSMLGSEGRGYCCLGVLACEMIPEFIGDTRFHIKVSGNQHYLPDDLTLLYGFDKETINVLADINDRNVTFEPVIAYIEENL